ncbi:translation elongation factor EF-Ts [Sporomusaceae bacterium BoRhaA]|uniref:hypothetical protein n=1 Tax=Pelorhabdus rhamnosifermentans TaxID=2772457 RepID=UPI001C0624AC|nr:hypothetical protein [Pelorhabdus rhamnosifermentans]MBU2703605.1 translation elongation factor EF-Ts [Pelorhabdus rhamnosifermentans]
MTVEMIRALRNKVGSGMMDCKKALEYSKGDFDLAIAYLEAKSLAVATPRATFDERVKMFYKRRKSNNG